MLNESSFKLKFDFYVHTTWKIKFQQSVYCFLSWVDDVDKTLVCTHFKLFARIFIFVSRTNNCVETTFSWKWNWPSNCRTCASCSFYDFFSRCIKRTVFVSFQTDTNFFVCHFFSSFVYLR